RSRCANIRVLPFQNTRTGSLCADGCVGAESSTFACTVCQPKRRPPFHVQLTPHGLYEQGSVAAGSLWWSTKNSTFAGGSCSGPFAVAETVVAMGIDGS